MLRRAGAVLFVLSTAFPVAAGLLRQAVTPRWLGVLDVIVAAALVGVGFAIVVKRPAPHDPAVRAAAWDIARVASYVLLLLVVVFLLAGDALRWSIMLLGLAWRAWFFVLVLPSWVAMGERRG